MKYSYIAKTLNHNNIVLCRDSTGTGVHTLNSLLAEGTQNAKCEQI